MPRRDSSDAPQVVGSDGPEVDPAPSAPEAIIHDSTSHAPEVVPSDDFSDPNGQQLWDYLTSQGTAEHPLVSHATGAGVLTSILPKHRRWQEFHSAATEVIESNNAVNSWARERSGATNREVNAEWNTHNYVEKYVHFESLAHDYSDRDGKSLYIPLVDKIRTHRNDVLKQISDRLTYAKFVQSFDTSKEPSQKEMIEKACKTDQDPDIQSDYRESFPTVYSGAIQSHH